MKSKNRLSLQQIERINDYYISHVDKIRRTGGSGVASELVAYDNYELILKITNLRENSKILSNFQTAAYIANSWKKFVKELNKAQSFVVLYYYRDYPVVHFDKIIEGALTDGINYIIRNWERNSD